MKTYKLASHSNDVIFLVEDSKTISISKDDTNYMWKEYLEWISQGNEPLPSDPIPEPEPLTPQQKLEAAGLSIEELKELLGL